jgi:hypothetical protein
LGYLFVISLSHAAINFVTNRFNYSKWMLVYILDMLSLPPEDAESFESGQFTIRQKPSCSNGIWSDMAPEKTVIRDSKGSGGIVNITRQKSTLIRWSLTRHVLADFRSEMKERSGSMAISEHTVHDEAKPACIKRDEEHVQLLRQHL